MGNVVNRVFDSSGPEGKVRGTPQQIIDKYSQLARDAQLSNDRVAAENFQQHSEHYTRLLGAAQREQDARREQQEQQHRDRQQNQQSQPQQRDVAATDPSQQEQPSVAAEAPRPAAGVVELNAESSDAGLVETPEEKPAPKRRAPRKPRAPKAAKAEDPPTPDTDAPETSAAE